MAKKPISPVEIENAGKMEEFKTKLLALMGEYDVQIGFTCGEGSDTHGLYDEAICFQNKGSEIRIDGYWVGLSDVRDAKITKLEE